MGCQGLADPVRAGKEIAVCQPVTGYGSAEQFYGLGLTDYICEFHDRYLALAVRCQEQL